MPDAKVRASCDRCLNSKVKCSQNKPSCTRCAQGKRDCIYSSYRRIGRPPKRPVSPLQAVRRLYHETDTGESNFEPQPLAAHLSTIVPQKLYPSGQNSGASRATVSQPVPVQKPNENIGHQFTNSIAQTQPIDSQRLNFGWGDCYIGPSRFQTTSQPAVGLNLFAEALSWDVCGLNATYPYFDSGFATWNPSANTVNEVHDSGAAKPFPDAVQTQTGQEFQITTQYQLPHQSNDLQQHWQSTWPESRSLSVPKFDPYMRKSECICPSRLSDQITRMNKLKADPRSTSTDLMIAIEADVRFERERCDRCPSCCMTGSNRRLSSMLLCTVLEIMVCICEAKLGLPVGQDASAIAADPYPDAYMGPEWVERGSKRHLYRQLIVALLLEHLEATMKWLEVLAGETNVCLVAVRQVCVNLTVRIQRIQGLEL